MCLMNDRLTHYSTAARLKTVIFITKYLLLTLRSSMYLSRNTFVITQSDRMNVINPRLGYATTKAPAIILQYKVFCFFHKWF